jgi:hypothetical protein
MTNYKTRLLEVNKKNSSGRIYTKECIENALKELNNKPLLIVPDIEDVKANGITFSHAIGGADNLRIEDNFLVADVGIIDEKLKAIMIEENVNIRPIGMGSVSENGEITNFKLLGLCVVAKP